MRALAIITAAVLFGGSLMWNAEAQTLRGASTINSASQDYTSIEKAACGKRWNRYCRPGYRRLCGSYGHRCWCQPCE